VDLWFEKLGDPKISQALQEVGAAYVPPSNFNPPMLAVVGVELFDIVICMDGLGKFTDEIKNCVDIPLGRQKLKVLSLERILASKIAANRAKDKLTIPVLRDAIAALQVTKRRAKKKMKCVAPRTELAVELLSPIPRIILFQIQLMPLKSGTLGAGQVGESYIVIGQRPNFLRTCLGKVTLLL
jgi:hypothetical protein